MKNATWNERTSYGTLRETSKRDTFPFMKNRRPPSVTSWNSLLKLTSRLQSSQTLTVSSTQRSVEKYIFVSPHLPDLPEIVWKRILSNLDSKSLSHCTCLCKSLHEIALHPDLWQMQCILAKVDCGPGIEQLLDKVDGHKGKWWREVYIRGIMKRQGWLTGNYKKRLIGLSDVDDVITCFKFDNDKVIIGTRKHKVKLFQSNIADFWNSPVAKHSAMYQGAHKSAIMCLDFSSSNGNILATGDADGTLAVWNIFTGDLLARQKRAHEKGISQVIMLDNRHIATCGFDKTIRIFRLLEYTIGAKQEYSPTSSRSSSVCPEQTVKRKGISRLFPSKVELIRPKTLVTMVKEFRGHRGEVYCMQALAKKTKLATGSTDHTIKIWDIKSSACITTLRGHSDTVTCLTAVGDLLFSGSLDKVIKIWKTSTGECLSMLIGHVEWIKSLNISGSILISGGWDETMYLWDIEKQKLVKRIKMDMGTITNIQSDNHKIVSVGREDGFQHQLAVIDFDRI